MAGDFVERWLTGLLASRRLARWRAAGDAERPELACLAVPVIEGSGRYGLVAPAEFGRLMKDAALGALLDGDKNTMRILDRWTRLPAFLYYRVNNLLT